MSVTVPTTVDGARLLRRLEELAAVGDTGDGLVMRAVGAGLNGSEECGDLRVHSERHFVDELEFSFNLLMSERTGELRGNVHDQSAAERDVEHLVTAADAKQRLALTEEFVEQCGHAIILPCSLHRAASGAR